MASSHQQNNYHQGMQADQSGHRANLLASLRTGGPNMNNGQYDGTTFQPNMDGAQLKPNAAVFIPSGAPSRRQSPPSAQQQYADGGRQTPRDASAMQASLEEQLAMMRLQAALAGQGGYPDQRQQHQHLQQQLLQQQVAARQQQLELLRLQALQQQQQQQQAQQQAQQQIAHQRFLLAQIHAEYERQAQVAALNSTNGHANQQQLYMQQGFSSNTAASAQEQRQAAQASIQASLRQRQAQQMYQQASDHEQMSGGDDHSMALALQHAQLLAMKQQQQQHVRNQSDGSNRVPLEQRSWRGSTMSERNPSPPLMRAGSPLVVIPGLPQHPRERTTSGTADSVVSWRSRAVTPSIVIDDSASEGSRSAAPSFDGDAVEGDQTPETSEEDLDMTSDLRKMLFGNSQTRQEDEALGGGGKYGVMGKGTPPVSLATPTMGNTPTVHAPKALPRAISLAAAPRHRAFTSEAKTAAESQYSINNRGLTLPPIQPRRQPKVQPTDFKEVNFQARINSRTRKDAMSKLCASPRAASFAGNGLGFGSRMVSASMS